MSNPKIYTSIGFSLEVRKLLEEHKKSEDRSFSYLVERAVKKDLESRKDLQEENAEKR